MISITHPSLLTMLAVLYTVSRFGLVVSQEARLVDALLKNYSPHTRPVRNHSHPITVKLTAGEIYMNSYKPSNGILDLTLTLSMTWTDELLSWDPNEFGNIQIVVLPSHLTWSPDIAVLTLLHLPQLLSLDNRVVHSSGEVTWIQKQRIQVLCPAGKDNVTVLTYAECTLKFISWTEDAHKLNLTTDPLLDPTDREVKNRYWNFSAGQAIRDEAYYACCPESFPSIMIPLKLTGKLTENSAASSFSPLVLPFSPLVLTSIVFLFNSFSMLDPAR